MLLRTARYWRHARRGQGDNAGSGVGFGADFLSDVFPHQNLHQPTCIPVMPDAPSDSVIRFDRVTVSFDGVTALRDISFEVLKGQARIILGAASSGKTVLLKTAMGLNPVEKGSVFVFGDR